jgi:hypothetical protein
MSDQPAVDLIVTSVRLGRFFKPGRFFKEIGRPVTGPPQPPIANEVAPFFAVSHKDGYSLRT